ncbi:hypothetical protein ACLOJK_015068 [Asimina triloba]
MNRFCPILPLPLPDFDDLRHCPSNWVFVGSRHRVLEDEGLPFDDSGLHLVTVRLVWGSAVDRDGEPEKTLDLLAMVAGRTWDWKGKMLPSDGAAVIDGPPVCPMIAA